MGFEVTYYEPKKRGNETKIVTILAHHVNIEANTAKFTYNGETTALFNMDFVIKLMPIRSR